VSDRQRLPTFGIPAELPAFLIVGALLLWASLDGGAAARIWLPSAVFVLCLAVLMWSSRSLRQAIRGGILVALGALTAFAVWSFASIGWAQVRGEAWQAANLAVLYLALYAASVLWSWNKRTLAVLAGAYAFAVASIGAVALFAAARGSDSRGTFFEGLLVEPIGYHNANAALSLIAFWPALCLAVHRAVPAVLRGMLLGTAGVLLDLALLSQSRGAAVAAAITGLVYVALVPDRARSIVGAAVLGGALFLGSEPLLDVYRRFDGLPDPASLDAAAATVAVTFAGLFVLGAVAAVVESRVRVGPRRARRLELAVIGAAAALALGSLVAVALAVEDPRERVSEAWADFKSGQDPADAESSGSHFAAGISTNRYDFWRVALLEFRSHPVEGAGAGNFAVAYVRERQSIEEPRYPHSLELEVLSQTGLVGAVLFVVFVAAAVVAAWPRGRERTRREVAGVGIAMFAYWLAHASIEWFWQMPALTGAALVGIGAAGRVNVSSDSTGETTGRRSTAVAALVLAGAAVAAASLLLAWLAVRNIDAAVTVWRNQPADAFTALSRARKLDPFSERSDVVEGAIASRLRNWPRMQSAFERAIERNPYNWYSRLELGLALAQQGRIANARSEVASAQALNPKEPTIAFVQAELRRGAPVDPRRIDQMFVERAEALLP
jgi:O-Antigen ligase